MRAHNANGERVARLLADHPTVETVWHPSLEDHPDREVAKRTMAGFGGIVSFQPKRRDHGHARAFLESLEYFQAAASLGGVESLATLPAETSHSYLSDKELEAAGLSRSFIRLAVGVEDVEDLEADLEQGLRQLA
jgi:cystathionine beta-lyase/cystathionine gamma-synthase